MNSKQYDQLIALREMLHKQQQDAEAFTSSVSFILGDLTETWTGKGNDSLQGIGQNLAQSCSLFAETIKKLEQTNQKVLEHLNDGEVKN